MQFVNHTRSDKIAALNTAVSRVNAARTLVDAGLNALCKTPLSARTGKRLVFILEELADIEHELRALVVK